jgi:segregation and condensation protein B
MDNSQTIQPDNHIEDAASADDTSRRVGSSVETQEQDTKSNLLAYLESLLFVAPGPVTASQLADAINLPTPEVERGLNELEALYTQEGPLRGLRLQRFGGHLQLTTSPQTAPVIERFLSIDVSSRLTRASLETLAIVMYKQPVTHPQVDAIRGVNSDAVLKSLLLKGLIQEVGRAEAPGRPILYSITQECLQIFGLSSLSELPPLQLDENSKPE